MFYEEFSKLSPEEKKIVKDIIGRNYEVWELPLAKHNFKITSLSLLIKEGQDIDSEGRTFIKPDEVNCPKNGCDVCGFITILAMVYDNDNEDIVTVHLVAAHRYDFFIEKRGKIVTFEPNYMLVDEYKIVRVSKPPALIHMASCMELILIINPPPKRLILLFIGLREIKPSKLKIEDTGRNEERPLTKCPWYKKLLGRKKQC